jgi:CRP/FNR family transcriptional regulator
MVIQNLEKYKSLLAEILEVSFSRVLHKHNICFYKDEKPSYLHFLEEGIIRLYTHKDDKEITVGLIHGPAFILPSSNANSQPFYLNSICETDCKLYFINNSMFKHAVMVRENIYQLVMGTVMDEVRFYQNFIEEQHILNHEERIAKFIYQYKEYIPLFTPVEIAQFLNITPEYLSRKLKTMIDNKIIEKSKNTIKILDVTYFQDMCLK